MARTVDRNQTIEEFRSTHNDLANDVGTIAGLAGSISNDNNLVDAINELEAKTFYFQTFEYVATAGQTDFTGEDSNLNTLELMPGRYQVFLNDHSAGTSKHLVEGTDYNPATAVAGKWTKITLQNAAAVNDVLTVYAFTGSVLGDAGGVGGAAGGHFVETAANTIYNVNTDGVILNGSSTGRTVLLESGYTIQLANGNVFVEDNLTLDSGKTLTAPTFTDGTATITGGVGTGFSSITSTSFTGALTGNATTSSTTASISGHAIGALSDVTTSGPTNGQVLVYNSSTSKWENDNAAATYTDEDAQDAAASMFTHSNHTNVTATYIDNGASDGEIRLVAAATYADSDVQSYLSGGDGLAMSGSGVFSVNTSKGIEINSDSVELDYEIVSSAPGSVGSTAEGHLWFVV